MKIQYASDLHLELSGNSRWIEKNPFEVAGDVLLLAGDVVYLGSESHIKHPFWDWCSNNQGKIILLFVQVTYFCVCGEIVKTEIANELII